MGVYHRADSIKEIKQRRKVEQERENTLAAILGNYDDLASMLVDQEYRLTMMELGITEEGGANDAV